MTFLSTFLLSFWILGIVELHVRKKNLPFGPDISPCDASLSSSSFYSLVYKSLIFMLLEFKEIVLDSSEVHLDPNLSPDSRGSY